MSEHPDYIAFRRESLRGIGLPADDYKGKDWRKRPMVKIERCFPPARHMQSVDEVKAITGRGLPFDYTIFTVPNWTWMPKWLWRFTPCHLELWTHIQSDF